MGRAASMAFPFYVFNIAYLVVEFKSKTHVWGTECGWERIDGYCSGSAPTDRREELSGESQNEWFPKEYINKLTYYINYY